MKKDFIIKLLLILLIAAVIFQFGLKPMITGEYNFESVKNNPWAKSQLKSDKDKYDVIVVGEEPEGIAAAVSAARSGARTLLVAEGPDLGGSVSKSLYTDLEANRDPNGDLLNRGIYLEFYEKLGEHFSVQQYIGFVNKLVKETGSLDTFYGAAAIAPVLDGSSIEGIQIGGRSFYGKRFIDATREGKLLSACEVPYYSGSGDINLPGAYLPVLFNFELDGVSYENFDISTAGQAFMAMSSYRPAHANVHIRNFNVVRQEKGRVILQGLQLFNVDVKEDKAVKEAYAAALREAEDIAGFLRNRVEAFKECTLSKVPEELYIREENHFIGERRLSINEILESKDFENKVAVGSGPVDAGKLSGTGGVYIAGNPRMYGIPLGSLIPLKIDNLLMAGGKISASSIAASSINTRGAAISTGEAAGVAAVFSIIKNMSPRVMAADSKTIKEIQYQLKKQGMYLPSIEVKNENEDNWSYSSVRKLNSLGLLAGGMSNDYAFNMEARQEDFAILLLNGIYRLSPDRYSLEFDSGLRRYFVKDKLTREKAGEILAAVYGLLTDKSIAYEKACQLGYIDGEMQRRLNKPGKEVLTMDEVFYLSAYNIEMFTGKIIED